MSVARRLAKYCTKDHETADAVVGLLQRFGIEAIAPKLMRYAQAHAEEQQRYTSVHIRAAAPVSAEEQDALRAYVGAPKDVAVVVEIDPAVIQGVEVSYKGKKWHNSAQNKLNRFVGTE